VEVDQDRELEELGTSVVPSDLSPPSTGPGHLKGHHSRLWWLVAPLVVLTLLSVTWGLGELGALRPQPPAAQADPVSKLLATMNEQRLADVTNRFTLEGGLVGEGALRYRSDGVSVRMIGTFGGAESGSLRLEFLVLPDGMYFTMPAIPLPGGRTWVRIDPDSPPRNPMLALMVQQFRAIQESIDTVRTLSSRMPFSELVGPQLVELDGAPCAKYTIRTDRTKLRETITDPDARQGFDNWTTIMGNTDEIHFWVDEDNRVRQMEMTFGQGATASPVIMKAGGWGEPVDIKPPPADQVISTEQMAQLFPIFG
jgi:hypothetical protein